MNNIAVIYKSRYGATKRYAEWIAEALQAALFAASDILGSQLASYDMVVYGGGLYASGISGLKLVKKNPCKSLVVFTVGLADPAATDYAAILQRNFPPHLLSSTKVFHFHGGIDYQNLGLLHKLMMAVLKNRLAKKRESELSHEDKAFLATYGQKLDFTNQDTIEPLVTFVKEQLKI